MWNASTSLMNGAGETCGCVSFSFSFFFSISISFSLLFFFPLRATGTAQPLPLTAIDPIRVFRRDFFARAPDTSLEANTGPALNQDRQCPPVTCKAADLGLPCTGGAGVGGMASHGRSDRRQRCGNALRDGQWRLRDGCTPYRSLYVHLPREAGVSAKPQAVLAPTVFGIWSHDSKGLTSSPVN